MKLSYSILYVEDVKRSMDFYQKAFGIEPRFYTKAAIMPKWKPEILHWLLRP